MTVQQEVFLQDSLLQSIQILTSTFPIQKNPHYLHQKHMLERGQRAVKVVKEVQKAVERGKVLQEGGLDQLNAESGG